MGDTMAAKKKVTKKTTKKKVAKKTAAKATKKKTTKKKAAKSAPMENLLVLSKTREAIKAHDCNIGGDALEGLNAWAHWLIGQAAKRAQANGRKTLRAHDFIVMD